MFSKSLSTFVLTAAGAALSGCSALSVNTQASQFETEVNAVMTEYSGVLQCLGSKIDELDVEPLFIYVREIDDETVPTRFNDRRLSKGAAWYIHTAIGKLETDKVISITQRPGRQERDNTNYMEISGAWTQDDEEIGVSDKNIGFDNLNVGILDRFGWFDRQQTSVIAGDFVSTMDDRVVHSSAISLAVKQNGRDYEMRIDDGSRRFDFGLRSDVNEGPQFAQRRIAEAATLVHISHSLEIDYRDCVNGKLKKPQEVRAAMQAYSAATQTEKFQLVQNALINAGYDPGTADGVWGPQSQAAMQEFQLDNDVLPTGIPTSNAYIMLLNHEQQST